jgi:hypothetical protein
MKQNSSNTVAEFLREIGISPNESDRNGEAANVVDGLFAIAQALNRIADEIAKEPRTPR